MGGTLFAAQAIRNFGRARAEARRALKGLSDAMATKNQVDQLGALIGDDEAAETVAVGLLAKLVPLKHQWLERLNHRDLMEMAIEAACLGVPTPNLVEFVTNVAIVSEVTGGKASSVAQEMVRLAIRRDS